MSFFDRLRRGLPGGAPATPFARGVAHLERGDPVAARAEFDAALAEGAAPPGRAAILNKRALALLATGDRDGALADLIAALVVDPQFVPAIVNVGNLLLEDGALDEAIVHYESAIRLDDTYHIAHLNLGVALRRAGRRAESVRHLRRAAWLEGRGAWSRKRRT